MIFFGASGHAKVVLEAWVASGGSVSKILDDNRSIKELSGFPVSADYNTGDFRDQRMIISIGSNILRKQVAERLPAKYTSVIHPSAQVSSSSRIGIGTVLMAGVVVNADAIIGNHVIANTGCVVEHGCVIGHFAHLSPNSTLCGNVRVGEGTHIGAGATIIQGINIGQWATIGAGSVIIEDVPDYAVVVGVPGRIIKKK
ncbi:MAG TPA: acetyltransferase [Cyclobacteriaceae bacterium]|nr:acetyltransferase [Cyclobacteriaceae bacterium]